MLNYIWAGLIIVSLVFALVTDVRDLARDTYRTGQALPTTLVFPDGYDAGARRQAVEVRLDPAAFAAFYGTEAPESPLTYPATLLHSEAGTYLLRLDDEADLPAPLGTIAAVTNPRSNTLQGRATPPVPTADSLAFATGWTFEPVRFVKMNAIAQAALDFAETAATLALGLIGVLALFLGLLKIGEAAGIVQAMSRLVEPVLRPLFPDIPPGHPAFSYIVLNLSANIFGLGNAATPFGIKAMEELQTLNPRPETATNAMVMFLAINTASVQVVPPVLLMALLGLQINQLLVPILLATGLSLIAAIAAAKGLGRLKRYREA